MQFPAERPEFFDQRFFDKMVDVFGVRPEGIDPCGIGFGAIGNLVERSERLRYFCRRENADGFKGLGPNTIDRNFIRQKPAVEREGTLERVELFVRLALEATAPKAIVFALGHWFHLEFHFLGLHLYVGQSADTYAGLSCCRSPLSPWGVP